MTHDPIGNDPECVRQSPDSREKGCNAQPSSYPPPLSSRASAMADRYSTISEMHASVQWPLESWIFVDSAKADWILAHSNAVLSLSHSASKAPKEALMSWSQKR